MKYTVDPVSSETNKWVVTVDFNDEGVDALAQNEVRGTEAQANAYAMTLARDFKENHADLFPPPPVVEHDPMMEEII
jgi:hypothetical protein